METLVEVGSSDVTCVSVESVRLQVLGILIRWGMPENLAKTTAELMAQTDLLGIDSHGISMLPAYEAKLNAGTLRIDAQPRLVRDTGATALYDGMGGLGYPVSAMAMQLAIDKALEFGVGAVSVRNSHHFGAAGVYARMAVERGVVGLVTSSATTLIMVPTYGATPMLGTNPIAFAAPAAKNDPFVLDMATTTVAANKVKVYDFHGKPLPEGWAVNGKGEDVTDSAQAMRYIFNCPEGGLTPLGGTPSMSSYKGYGLAMMAQILGGTLSGSALAANQAQTRKVGDPDDVGHFFLALNPRVFRDSGTFEDELDVAIDTMHATPPADPAQPVMVAGDREEAERRRRRQGGIPIPNALETHVRNICQRSGADYVLAAL